jgi:hypothetical protein
MKHLKYILLLIIFISCESKTKYKKPENLIPKEEMINLLVDMHLATGTIDVKDKNDERDLNYMVLVYEKYQIDSARLADSNFYYISNIEEYEYIFKEVEKKLKILQEKYELLKDTVAEKRNDSIRKKQRIPNKLGRNDIVK